LLWFWRGGCCTDRSNVSIPKSIQKRRTSWHSAITTKNDKAIRVDRKAKAAANRVVIKEEGKAAARAVANKAVAKEENKAAASRAVTREDDKAKAAAKAVESNDAVPNAITFSERTPLLDAESLARGIHLRR
jgi:hypothetical protein